jgi:hypothetical protein
VRRQLALVPILLLLSLAACGGEADGTTSTAPSGETVTPAPDTTYTVPTAAPTEVSKATPSGSGDPAWGTQYAFLRSSEPATRRITYDLIEWYDGAEAVKACAEDGERPAENDYCEGYYIRNNNTRLRTLTVHPDAPIRMTVPQERAVDLETFLSEVGEGSVIRFDIDANRIMKLEPVYLP